MYIDVCIYIINYNHIYRSFGSNAAPILATLVWPWLETVLPQNLFDLLATEQTPLQSIETCQVTASDVCV